MGKERKHAGLLERRRDRRLQLGTCVSSVYELLEFERQGSGLGVRGLGY